LNWPFGVSKTKNSQDRVIIRLIGWECYRAPTSATTALAWLAEAGEPVPCPPPTELRAGAEPETKKTDVVWFALNEDRLLFAFAGIWTTYNGDRGTKSKPVPVPH
jgi:hypothetical protein